MTADSTTLQITLNFNFPDADPTKQPVITNSTAEIDTATATDAAVYWESTSNLGFRNDDSLQITGIQFFSDRAKTQPLNPACLNMPGANYGRLNWMIQFNSEEVANDLTIYYTVTYKDAHFENLSWDPTLTIQKRNASSGAPG